MSGNRQLGHHQTTAMLLGFSAAMMASVGGIIGSLTGMMAVTMGSSGIALVVLFFAGVEIGRSRSKTSD